MSADVASLLATDVTPSQVAELSTTDCRGAWSATLAELAADDRSLVAVVNDSVGSSKLGDFVDRFPGQVVNVGIAEQTMVGVAAGLSGGGLTPFVSAASCFLTARAMEQIKADLVYSGRPVVLCGMSPGVAYGELGPTHHSLEDIAWLRALPGMTVVVPADPVETAAAIRWAHGHDGPAFVRVSRMPVPTLFRPDHAFEPGKANLLHAGNDVTVIANGTTVSVALQAAGLLADRGIGLRVLSMASVQPLDQEAVLAAATETGGIVTVEESTVRGGLGGAVAELVVSHRPAPMRMLGINHYDHPDSAEGLIAGAGLTPLGIADAAAALIDR